MNAGTDVLLISARLRLTVHAGSVPLIQIFGSTPSTELTTLTDPSFGTGSLTYTFNAASAFTLRAGTTYWLMVFNTGAGHVIWRASSPSIIPTGSEAVHVAYRVGQTLKGSTSFTRNTYELNGTANTAVPEPASLLLMAGGSRGPTRPR